MKSSVRRLLEEQCDKRSFFKSPAVATAGREKLNPHALPLDDFAAEVMQLLSQNPTPDEILVERVLTLRWAERDGTYDDLVAQRSQALAMLPSRQG